MPSSELFRAQIRSLQGPSRVLPWRRGSVLLLGLVAFALITLTRYAIEDPSTTVFTFFLLPIALMAMEFGLLGGVLGAAGGSFLTVSWVVIKDVQLQNGQVATRCLLLAIMGIYFGYLGDRQEQAILDRALVADQILYMEALTVHGLIRLDRAGKITGWNRGATEILGYTVEEASSRTLDFLLSEPVERFEVQTILNGAVARGLWEGERSLQQKGGGRCAAAISVTPLGAGRDAGFALVLNDLTASNLARDESSRMWEVSFQLLATVRADGYFQRLNPRWEEVLGWNSEELAAKPFIDFVHPDDREVTLAETAALLTGDDGTACFENRYRCKDGTYRYLMWNALTNLDDELIYAAALDITDRQHQEAAVEAANKELEAFSYSVSHDLRAPLRAIDGYTQAILEDVGPSLPPQSMSDLNRVRAASQRMSILIDEMLALSRVTRHELREAQVDLARLAGEVTAELGRFEADREVRTDIEPRLNVVGDPELLRLVLHNLLDNAWKFTAQTDAAHVELTAVGCDNGRSTFMVRDNGAGFDMRYADKLFLPFERLHRQDEFAGTGVGLATVARVLKRHGGTIWAEGSPGHGASFFFDLPTGKQHA